MRKKPRWLPRCWRSVALPKDHAQVKGEWRLVLSAAAIPYLIVNCFERESVYVPAIYQTIAERELEDYEKEKSEPVQINQERPCQNAKYVLIFFFPLIFWHGLRSGAIKNFSFLPDPSCWQEWGCLDAVKIRIAGEWSRIFTSLTLHADIRHLSGNVFIGALFLFILARIIGPGRALLLSLLGGAFGNALSVFIHAGNYRSLGFSTAVFSAIGICGGLASFKEKNSRGFLAPLAAAAGLLALLGADGGNVDYAAHVCGLVCGIFLGFFEGRRESSRIFPLSQARCAIIAIALLAAAWLCAFMARDF